MNYTLVVLLVLLLIVMVIIAIKLHSLYLSSSKSNDLLHELIALSKPKGNVKRERTQSQNDRITEFGILEAEKELKKFDAKGVTIKRVGHRKAERISIKEFKRIKKIYGKDAFKVIEYHK